MKALAKYIRKSINENENIEITFEIADIITSEEIKLLNKEKIYLLDIEERKKKKTLQQNKFVWKLCQLIAKKLNDDNDELDVYCNAIEFAGVKADFVMGLPEIEETLKKQFRVVKIVEKREYNEKEMYVYKIFYGSSKFNKEEEAKIIEYLLYLAEKLDINTEFWEGVLKNERTR